VHAHADGQFWPHRSIKFLHLHLWHKYQANPMKNNEVKVHWNVPKFNIFACMHVQANYFDHSIQLGTSISIYHINLIKFEQRIKKLVLHVFMCKNSNARARACMHFQKKSLWFGTSLQTLDYHPGKFMLIPWVVSENIPGQKSTGE
jgi:hypothetical protein